MTDDKKDQFHANKNGVFVHNTIEKSGKNIRTIFFYDGDIEDLIGEVEEASIKEESIKLKKIPDEEQRFSDVENVYEIYSDKGTEVVGKTYERNVMIIRGPKDGGVIDDCILVANGAAVYHGKEEFSIMGDKYCPTCNQEIKERTEIIAKCSTLDLAEYRDGAELLPGTSYEFYLDKKLIAKFNMNYYNSEMTDVNPTIEDFEVENESYKEIIVRGIEERVEQQGFKKIWLTNYIGYPPETDFWRKMEYEFDIDEGYKEFY